jgi:RHS repeat-associated protein
MKVEEGHINGTGKNEIDGYIEISGVTGGIFDQYLQGWYSYIKEQVGTIYKVYSENGKQVIDTRSYDTFGNIINRLGTSTGNLGFQGKYYDQESGLYYFFYRYYNPSNGRFINEDPIGLSGGLNMYRAFGNNPNYNSVSDSFEKIAKGVTIVAIIYFTISESLRILFPPRNFVPIP